MPEVSEWVDPLGTPVSIIGNGIASPRWRARAYALGVAWTLFRRRKEAAIAYFLMQGLQVLVGVPVARLLGMRVVMKFSGSGEISRLKQTRLGRLELYCLRKLAHRILILNDGMREEARDAGLDDAQLLWIPNPVDTEEFTPGQEEERLELRRTVGLAPEAPVVLFVGRLAPEKALHSLLGAFRLVTESHPEAVLALVGDGPSRGELETLAAGLGLKANVLFVGMIDAKSVRGWLRLSDVFALVSPLEGISCALLEAMSSGLPSVVSDIPANTLLVEHGVNGLVARQGDEQAIAGALCKVIEDRELRLRLGKAARIKVVAEYSTEKVVDRYEALFRGFQPGCAVPGWC